MSEQYLSEDDVQAIINFLDTVDGEEDNLARAHGQHILDAVAARDARLESGEDPVLDLLRQAHKSREADKQ
jgi:hypothetical protein